MGAITSYQCDGPGCVVLVEKPKGNQYPPLDVWPRVTLKIAGGELVGCFHAKVCALRWTDEQWDSATDTEGPGEVVRPAGAPPDPDA